MRFIARQPVFDSGLKVFGYELLFRAGFEDFARIGDAERAARMTLDNSMMWGLDQLCGNQFAFVNCTRAVLTKRLVELLPPRRTIVEVLEDVAADREILEACRALRGLGYRIALDDVCSMNAVNPFVGIAEIVKVDFRLTSSQQQTELARDLRRLNVTALAEKVETSHEYRAATRMGYQMFQGFFFQRPEVMRRKDIPALRPRYVRLLEAIQQPELDLGKIEEVIRTEPSLCFRLLRYLNSSLFAFDEEIASVRHAIRLLGEKEIRRWLLVAIAGSLGENKPQELVVEALVKARFSEALSEKMGHLIEGPFLMGMLSGFPALLEIPLEAILQCLPIAPQISDALLGRPGPHRNLLDIMSAYEAGEWASCSKKAEICGLSEHAIASCYLEAVEWAEGIAGHRSSRSINEGDKKLI